MERESFEDNEVAEVLNKYFVSIKVDREERPDLDQLYLSFCQIFTGQAGWPLTVFLTPEKKPFFAGTYFPKKNRAGMLGLLDLLKQIAQLWLKEKEKLIMSGETLTKMLYEEYLEKNGDEMSPEFVKQAYQQLVSRFDPLYGGFGGAPKFPTAHRLTFLLHYYYEQGMNEALFMVEKTLKQLYKGGIFDHLGFGFSRYATDRKWLVPHFEKMLYDNALLAIAYLEAYQVTGRELYRKVVKKIFTYLFREMTAPEGGFYSAIDADSEGEEGKYYLWSPRQVKKVLGDKRGREFCHVYGLTEKGNFAGSNILNLLSAAETELEEIEREFEVEREKLYQARQKRVPPFKDDKILTAWNGLMIAALAKAGRVLGDKTYLAAAEKAFAFFKQNLVNKEGRLLARYRHDEAAIPAYLDDYAFMVWALLELYIATYHQAYLKEALNLNQKMLCLFSNTTQTSLYLTGEDSEKLIVRPREIEDGALPAGNSVAILNLLKLGNLSRDEQLIRQAEKLFTSSIINDYPLGSTFLLQAYLYAQNASTLVIVEGENEMIGKAMLAFLRQTFLPFTAISYYKKGEQSIYSALDQKTTAYFCKDKTCLPPLQELNEFKKIVGIWGKR